MALPDYQFLLRDRNSLAITAEIRPQDVEVATWQREQYGNGSFALTLPRNSTYTPTVLAKHQILEVIRKGVLEFWGSLELRGVDDLAKFWTIGGPQLTGFILNLRVVGETAADASSGATETVLKDYVNRYLGPGAAAARQLVTYCTPATFTVDPDLARGSTVYGNANRKNLFQLTRELALAGNVLQEVQLNAARTGYVYVVSLPTNATIGTGAVPFSVGWDNVASFLFTEDYRQHANHLFVAGDGSAGARNVTEIEDAASVSADWRREAVIDASYATDVNKRTTVGNYEAALRKLALTTVNASPLYDGGTAVYRTNWDVGWDVTFAQSDLREASIDVRIAAATVKLDKTNIESIGFTLGMVRQDDELRRLGDMVTRIQNSSNV